MAPQFVKPYVKTNKNDAADVEAICKAVTRPTMRFVPIKNSEQLAILALHRARQGFIKARTAQANQIRGLLAEYGFILPQGITHIGKHVPELLEDSENGLPGTFRHLLMRLHEHLKMFDKQVNELEDAIVRWHKGSAASQTLAQLQCASHSLRITSTASSWMSLSLAKRNIGCRPFARDKLIACFAVIGAIRINMSQLTPQRVESSGQHLGVMDIFQ